MNEFIAKIVQAFLNPQTLQGQLLAFAGWVILLNVFLSAVGKALDQIAGGLDAIKDKTATKVDDNAAAVAHKIADVLLKVTGYLQIAIDWMQGNRSH